MLISIKNQSRKLKGIQRNGKIFYAPRLEELTLLKWPYYPKYGFSVIPTKLPMTFFTEIKQTIQKFMWNHKRPRISKAILRKKAGVMNFPDFRQYYRATVNKKSVLLGLNRYTDQCKRIDNPEVGEERWQWRSRT